MVSHTHWDREWYRTFEAFRSHLIDTVDRVLDQLDEDPGWRYLLDGQSIVAEDYLEIRPHQRERLVAAVSGGRLALGPWYVQPDSLLPSGESHLRNLLEGRLVAESFGGSSRVAYTPDSFGHPAHFPQLFSGFGLGPFVYWRGNGNEIDDLGTVYRWEAPDGSSVLAYVMARGYFSAAGLPDDPEAASEGLADVVDDLDPIERAPTLLMNGVDHMYPQTHTAAVAAALAARTGREVRRGLLDELVDSVDPDDRGTFTGDLLGARLSNLLPGVWSSRLMLKLDNRRAERTLMGWAEPWAALGHGLGLPDERPALRTARRALLANHAHDSIGGCSQDEVHRQMAGRFATATELSDQTCTRVLERLAGLGVDRHTAWDMDFDLAVFNPSPFSRTDVVRLALDGFPLFRITYGDANVHPFSMAAATVAGFAVDGRPVRVVRSDDPGRVRVIEDWYPLDLELVATDVPAFGWKRLHLEQCPRAEEEVDEGRSIANETLSVSVSDDGTLTLTHGDVQFTGLLALEDTGDRGDTYDFDPVEGPGATLRSVDVERRRHPSGIEWLTVTRRFDVPSHLEPDRNGRSADMVTMTVVAEVRVAPAIDRVDLTVRLDNPAGDHRVRLLFPTGAPVDRFTAATTFGVATRSTTLPEDDQWWHPSGETFPHQGWIAANGLVVGAPGLPEGEVTVEGTIAVTLLRGVGWLSHIELRRRPIPAGPTLIAPDAQCPDGLEAALTLRVVGDGGLDADRTAAVVWADELGLRAVVAGPSPIREGESLVRLEPASLVLSALKPAEDGDGLIVRVLNPTAEERVADVRFGVALAGATSVRLDETPDGLALDRDGDQLRFTVGPHALRSIRVRSG